MPEVYVKYVGKDIAKYFGATKNPEVVQLAEGSTYGELIEFFYKRFCQCVQLKGGKMPNKELFGAFVFISDGRNLKRIADEPVKNGDEIVVIPADAGG